MVNIQKIQSEFGDNICRRCINKLFKSRLDPADCRYGYTYTCPVCKKVSNIVVGFNMSGRGKLLFK